MASLGGFLRSLFFKDYSKDYEDEIRGQYADGNYLYDENGKLLSQDEALAGVPNNNEYSLSNLLGNGGLLGALVSYLNSKTGNALTGAQREQNVFNAEQATIERGWSERMSNTAYQRSVSDMQNAGLNPALMFGNAGASAAPSGAVASGSSPSAPAFSLMSMLMQAKQHKEELKNQKEIALDQSDTAVKVAEINAGVGEHANEIREKELDQRIFEARSKIRLEEEQAKTEEQKRNAIEKSMVLDEANANRINELLPYEKAVMTADTAEKRWSAELNMVKAGLENSLISNGLVHYIMENYRLGNDISELKKDIMKLSYDFDKDKDTPAYHFVHKVSSIVSGVTDSYLVDPKTVLDLFK